MLPVAEEIGAAPYLAVPEQNAAERQIERFEDGASLEEIYAEQVEGDGEDRWLRASAPTEEELLEALDRIAVADVLVQALATTASIGFRRVSAEARDLAQARLAIEASARARARAARGRRRRGARPRPRAGAGEPPARVREGGRSEDRARPTSREDRGQAEA